MPTSKKAPSDEAPDPDKLTRETPGSYRSGDGRFEVRQADTGWYLVDLERTNEFGQELIHGPYGALKDARAALPGARRVTPLPAPKLTAAAKRRTEAASETRKPPAPPQSWIDKLPGDEAAGVRRVIRALEREHVPNAEDLVRMARAKGGPSLAAGLIQHRLRTLVDESDPDDRRQTRELVRRVLNILTEDGLYQAPSLPRWALVEVEGDAPERRLQPKV